MNNEQMQRAIDFLVQSQVDFYARSKEFHEADRKLEVKLDKLSETVRKLAVLGRNLVKVEQMYSRRLDRLEGFPPK